MNNIPTIKTKILSIKDDHGVDAALKSKKLKGSENLKHLILIRLFTSDRKDSGYVDMEVVEYGDGHFSFKDIKDCKYMGQYEQAYLTAFRWWEIYKDQLIKKIKKELIIRNLVIKPETGRRFNKVIRNLMESLDNTVQDLNTAQQLGMKQLMHNILNHPKGSAVGLLDLIKKTPGMYADLMYGKMDELNTKFLQLGVDFSKIANLVDQARELANKERAGQKVPVRRATAIPRP